MQTNTPEYSEFIALSRYARWLPDENRRESWEETVDRYISFFSEKLPILKEQHDSMDCPENYLYRAIKDLEIMPSMRSLMTAGEALRRDNVAGYNCSYLPLDSMRSFDELMYILMCGTGVGYSVERKYVNQLPDINERFDETDTVIQVRDSKIGWATAFRELLSLLYSGRIPRWDTTKVRPAGARLKTFGGRASGPEPLEELFRFTVRLFTGASGRKLTSLEAHDLACKIAEIVVVGGVRRSALICLTDIDDDQMRRAKSGQWWIDNPQRALANISYVAEQKPELHKFLDEWSALYESKSGERGIFSRIASREQAAKTGRREDSQHFGTNPCSEIILRPYQFCNLSEVVVRPEDSLEDLKRKVRGATILGTIQSTLTDFRYLRKIWRDNTEEERLLGVSLTGIMDHPWLNGTTEYDQMPTDPSHGGKLTLAQILEELKNEAIETNKQWAAALGINQSVAITCVKPSGTVSQLVDSASGIHPRYSHYYIRTVRADKKDPIARLMIDQGVPCEDDQMNSNNYVFSFPIKSPENSVTTADQDAMTQLELWKVYQDHWCEHKPSCTVSYTDKDFLHAGAWVYDNFDKISGVSFLPYSDHTYPQAPYQEISKEEYEDLRSKMPVVDFSVLHEYETEDTTANSKELSCSAGVCETVDITK